MEPRALVTAIAGPVVLAGLGCQAILDIPEEIIAYRWCLDATGARARRHNDFEIQFITQATSMTWTRGCKCYCPSDHAIMVQGANGTLAPGSGDESFYQGQVDLLRARAQLACTERALEIGQEQGTTLDFDDPQAISCSDAVASELPYYTSECLLGEDMCPTPAGDGGGGGGLGTDGGGSTSGGSTTTEPGADETTGAGSGDASTTATTGGVGAAIYGLDDFSTVLSCPTAEKCEIEAAFVDELLADLSLLSEDAIALDTGTTVAGHRGFVFIEVGERSLPAALGVEPGDILWRVEEIELRTFTDVGMAFEQLDHEPEVAFHLERDGQPITRTIRRVEVVEPS